MYLTSVYAASDDSVSAKGYPHTLDVLATHIGVPDFLQQVANFMSEQDAATEALVDTTDKLVVTSLAVFHSAVAIFHAPGDASSIDGFRREIIRSTPKWRSRAERRDCFFVEHDPSQDGFRGLYAARARMFFSFKFGSETYLCALAELFSTVGDEPDELTGMWVVEPDLERDGRRRSQSFMLTLSFAVRI